ncbi:tRNA dihydrouridine synthase DusB, partial [bacterium]|nr:tRNA dihydrouridine synthase DusB [bacterium]
MTHIGPFQLKSKAVLAPMAGVTDQPFRSLCLQFGAGAVTAEMTSSNPKLWHTRKSTLRRVHQSLPSPRIVQILGTEPEQMAAAARYNVDLGAEVIDINMGCPAKKVCKKLAGSALMKDERLVADILTAVVNAIDVPVTLKTRTGWSCEQKNAVNIAKIAENCGIQSLAIHGRTRACRYNGKAEYDTIAEVVAAVDIPVFANGDIQSAEMAKSVLDYTHAAGVMIG